MASTAQEVLDTYTAQALATAQPEAFSLDYLVPGIVGEVGEMFGHVAKACWHGRPLSELEVDLVKELGDVAWMTATLLHVQGATLETARLPRPGADPWHILLQRSTALHQYYSEGLDDYLGEAAARLWVHLANACEDITGSSLEHVLAVNLDKLASRAARGTLRGNGDNR